MLITHLQYVSTFINDREADILPKKVATKFYIKKKTCLSTIKLTTQQ